MNQSEIKAAIAQQEEYIKRWNSCGGVLGRGHEFETFRGPDSAIPVPNEITWRQCVNCDVTETTEDYLIKIGG